MRSRHFVILGGLLAAVAVGLGAIGAHALKGHLSAEQLATYHTAVQYQLYHALGLILIGVLEFQYPCRLFVWGGWLILLGILLFSGLLYVWVATGIQWFVYPVPVGGIAFICGWLMLAGGAACLEAPQKL